MPKKRFAPPDENEFVQLIKAIRDPNQIRQDCARKLLEVRNSEHFHAILRCLLEENGRHQD